MCSRGGGQRDWETTPGKTRWSRRVRWRERQTRRGQFRGRTRDQIEDWLWGMKKREELASGGLSHWPGGVL